MKLASCIAPTESELGSCSASAGIVLVVVIAGAIVGYAWFWWQQRRRP